MGEKTEGSGRVSRREFIVASGVGVAGIILGYLAGRSTAPAREVLREVTITTTTPVEREKVVEVPVVKAYERVKIANIRDLRVGEPFITSYMGKTVVVLKLGEPAIGGVGPDGDIVAFSTLCTHMGGGLVFDKTTRTLICPIHYSQFDPARDGMVVIGHATEYLPRVLLEYDANTGDIYAVGFNRLVYGYKSNL